jgi:hypothetical protein
MERTDAYLKAAPTEQTVTVFPNKKAARKMKNGQFTDSCTI